MTEPDDELEARPDPLDSPGDGAPRPEAASFPTRRILLGILVLAAILRTAHLANHLAWGLSKPEVVVTSTDMHGYAEWAQRIADGDLLSADTYHPLPDQMPISTVGAVFAATGWGA